MNAAELDALIRQFLVDHTLSNAERTTLMAWVKENIDSEHNRALARKRVFESARQAVNDPKSVAVIDFIEDVLKVIVPVPVANANSSGSTAEFSPGDACLGLIVNRLRNTRQSADICVFTITDDRISNAIIDAHRRGVKVRIITDNEKAYDAGSDVPRFLEAKIPLKVDHTPYHMHHKFAIFDGHRLLNGSYNWTRGAAEYNEENVVDTDDKGLVASFQKEFNTLWNNLEFARL